MKKHSYQVDENVGEGLCAFPQKRAHTQVRPYTYGNIDIQGSEINA